MKTLKHFIEFSDELYNDRYYGESLLVLHGISFGVKIGKQLKLKWSDFINEIGHIKDFVVIDGRTIPLNTTCKIRTLVIYRLLKNKIISETGPKINMHFLVCFHKPLLSKYCFPHKHTFDAFLFTVSF